jgi:hypothetical protein
MTDYLITPSPELIEQWANTAQPLLQVVSQDQVGHTAYTKSIALQAAQWAADRELEACCNWLPKLPPWSGEDLRKHRRPKPRTQKELALLELADVYGRDKIDDVTYDTIRVALEALPE